MKLEKLRADIDQIDAAIINLLAKRRDIALSIAAEKKKTGQSVLQRARFEALLKNREGQAEKQGLSKSFIRKIWHAIHDESVKVQRGSK